jgi:DNA-directed RNA polymerase subunit K/omega
MNATLIARALVVVPNRHVLVNLISRRVRQLNSDSGRESRRMLADSANLTAAGIALLEIIEGHMDFEMPQIIPLTRPTRKGQSTEALGRAQT